MSLIFRALTYATFFVGFLFIYLPNRILSWTGITRPAAIGWPQITGSVIGSAGVIVALWCVCAFLWIGKGTPAPFDPPRKLVIRGPYRFVRNPMYIGAVLALAGTALFYESAFLALYGGLFLLAAHLVVILREEPILRRSFGSEYETYCHHVRRWWPSVSATHYSGSPIGIE